MSAKYAGRDYGSIAYFVDSPELTKCPCFITLSNMENNAINKIAFDPDINAPKRYEHDPADYGRFLREENKHLYTKKYTNDIFFLPEHLCSALAYHLIDTLRGFKDEPEFTQEISQKILSSSGENNQLQKVLNSLFNPELHIPRALRTRNYKKTQFREYTVKEAFRHHKTELLLDYLTSKDKCIKMLGEILDDIQQYGYLEHPHMKPVLEKIFSCVGRADLSAIKTAYAETSTWSKPDKPADLAYYLCREWNKDNRELLLQKGIIKLTDPISTSHHVYKAKTMGELIKEMGKLLMA